MANILIYFLKKDIKSRYAGSGLGLIWAFLLPLFQIFLFWFVFAGILKARPFPGSEIPYLHFLLSSFFCWLAFSEGLMRSTTTILENSEIVKKVSFPNIVLPISATLSSYAHHLIGLAIFLLIYTVTVSLHFSFVFIVPVLALQIAFSAGLGMILASLLPYFRDLGQIMGYVLQGTFFLSPVMYSIDLIPEKLKFLVLLNPFTYFAVSYQKMILFKKPPDLFHFGLVLLFSLFALAVGTYIFRRLKDGFADVL
ncbi:MAG: ABC transporter permease [Nitrospirota bacterium]